MIKITEKQILILHDKGIEKFGGIRGIRDVNLFKSCCVAPYQTMFGKDLYPDIYDKALRYLEGFATNQVFLDGNKRTAVASMLIFLRLNGILLDISDEELINMCLDLSNKKADIASIKRLLIAKTKNIQ